MSRANLNCFLARVSGMIALALVLAAKPASAQYTFYSDFASWSAAVHNTFLTEDFSDTTLNPGLSYSTINGSISGGTYNDSLMGFRNTTFKFTPSVYAVGGNFNLTPGGASAGIKFQLHTENGIVMVTQQIPNTANGGFYGIVSNYEISQLTIKAGNQVGNGPGEAYFLDNLRYASPGLKLVDTAAAVPEPGEYATAGIFVGFVAFGMIRARRRTKANIHVG